MTQQRIDIDRQILASMRSTCLIAYLVFSPRANARPCPIKATASEADSIAPSVAPARERMRFACRSWPNTLLRKRWIPSNEIGCRLTRHRPLQRMRRARIRFPRAWQ